MKLLAQKFSIALFIAISWLPFSVLYLISDFLFLIVFYLVGYRRKVVDQNLLNAFPEKSDDERKQIAGKYYHHFCDLLVETIKMNRLPDKKIRKHIQFRNIELLDKYFDEKKGVILMCAHYNNWEWNSSMQLFHKHRLLMVYSEMRGNIPMNDFILKTRSQYGGIGVPMGQAPRAGLSINQGPEYKALWLAADQTPPAHSQYWTTFLNQETPFFSGPQKIAMKTNSPLIYHYIHKVKRGKYIAEFFEVNPSPATSEENTVLLDYANIIEQIIRNKPEYWLWSHRRWKHKRTEDHQLIERRPNPELAKRVSDMLQRLESEKPF